MKRNQSGLAEVILAPLWITAARGWLLPALSLVLFTVPCRAAERQFLHDHVPALVTNAAPVGRSSRWARLDLGIGLPLREREALTNLLQQLYDPASTNYHQYLTPEQFAHRFGPTERDYQAVVRFAQSHALAVTGTHPNRTLVNVRGTVAAIEQAFHVLLNEYQHPTEPRRFYAPSVEPSLDLAVAVLAISGLDNYVMPHPCFRTIPLQQPRPNLTGSGPSGFYLGYDFRHAYAPGVSLTGSGLAVGLVEFDGYHPHDVAAYLALAGLPSVPITTVLLDGFNGSPGAANIEVALDIDMAIAMAPGLSQIIVYEGTTANDVLNRIATDRLARQISASWTYPVNATTLQIFLQFAAQGQSFFNASGDSGAYSGPVLTPADNPYITVVGGTDLTTTPGGGARTSETTWPGSSGGVSLTYPIPSWQQGVSMTANQGSTTYRNLPDVAMVADNCYLIANSGQEYAVSGTSISAPLWASFTALVNQLALTNGESAVGFINPAVYALGKGSNALSYTALFHDITTGNNKNQSSPARFSAVAGYDLCTGWGTPTGSSLITALAIREPLQITPAGSMVISGPVGGPFSPTPPTYSLTNNAGGSLSWSLVNTSSWLNVSPTSGTLNPGGPATTVTVSLAPAATNLTAGSYSATLRFTNFNDNFGQTRQITLAVVTPPVITAQPTNQALLLGMTANFRVGTAPNALLLYQWQENGNNLNDGGNVSGSATGTLTISNVLSASVGAYSVIVSNAAGVVPSSNAFLTIVPSEPVIVLQPTNQTVLPGATASFSVAAVGDTPYLYQWQVDGTNLSNSASFSGVTSSTLTINSVSPSNAGTYSALVTNALGWASSTGAVLSVISVTVPGLTMSTLWSFNGNSGKFPYSPLAGGRDGNFYGTTIEGGTSGAGTVFRVNTNGSLFTVLSFNGNNGAIPFGGLVLARDGYYYGTTYTGAFYGDGTVFRIIGGMPITLATFNGNNGAFPVAGLVQGSDGNFYGTANQGGAYGYGTVFRITGGGTLTTLVAFNYSDGAFPSPVLAQGSDGNFYGTTENGGTNGGHGTVFKMTPSGTFTRLYSFGTNDGATPIAGVVQGFDGNFYGTTLQGGNGDYGTVFKITPSGTLTTLYSFTGGNDGANPWGGLVQASDGNLYGTTQSGGAYSFGTVFNIAPNGPLTTLAQFDGYNGAAPSAALVQLPNGNLYGTTQTGGANDDGTIFRLSISGPLQITGQPADQSAYTGGAALFTVATFGSGPVFYQWQRDGINLSDGGDISGATNATLRITNITTDDAALYSVVVSNTVNSLISDDAVLEVIISPPHIITQPVSQTRVAGTSAAFTVAALGDLPLFYQWQENGTNLTDGGNISGAATSTLTLANVSAADDGTYSVVVSNTIRAVSSDKAVLTVVPATPAWASVSSLRLFTGGGDGAFPYAGLMQGKDGNLYGTGSGGGSRFYGTIFRMALNGGLNTLYNFTDGVNGAYPYGGLVQGTNGNLYGTTLQGGTNGYGTVFRMTTFSAVTFLHSFTSGLDGAFPFDGLVQALDGNFYGTAYQGGANSSGSVFKMTPTGAVTPLYEFTGESDGAYPYAGLVQGKDGNFYGTTIGGGVSGYGTVFSLSTNGALTTLVSFDYTNGGYPAAALVHGTDGNLYGTTSSGGAGGQGTAFGITTNGTLTTLLWFDGFNGASPQAALVQASNGNFYGTTPQGGTGYNPSAGGGNGTVFRLTVPSFISNSFAVVSAIASLPYSANLADQAIAPPGDPLLFAKVSGPAWLNLASDGALSGTPVSSDVGTNVFVVSLTDSNGVSASATMRMAVKPNSPPTFISNPFSEPSANVDQPYSGTIATNASDSELGLGDVLTFAKLSGPAWLSVASNGALSGTPEASDGGSNTSLVSVTDLGGSASTATLSLYVNSAPSFIPHNFTKPAATVGLRYFGTIATNATDPDLGAGDSLTFYKVTGPDWLNVAANGGLYGAPSNSDVGANTFLMLVADSGGLAGIGSLGITVNTDHPPAFTSDPFAAPRAN